MNHQSPTNQKARLDYRLDSVDPRRAARQGFTLIELLVVTAILGILIGIATNVFVGLLRSQNKTSITGEVNQNAKLVIDLFERDVRSATGISVVGLNVTLEYASDIVWTCVPATPTANGYITRQEGTNPAQTLTNTDTVNGVSVTCDNPTTALAADPFTVSGSGTRRLVSFGFSLDQGVSSPTRNDYRISLPFQTTVGTRVF